MVRRRVGGKVAFTAIGEDRGAGIILMQLYFCMPPTQEQIANGIQGPASMPSSSILSMGSYSLDKEVLKKLGIGLTLAAAVLAFIVEKLF
ncbi:threonylcarbamoyladenosine tRNA methylthiotransferase isoform X1 [Lates japonicus]|uniref:Threonylcarbamoyladenosine tRNA methylthiotransferase isoform X1 n=1 Tax=Lates japonicus TaxID=270547 RepID=A0AAD3R5E8_LATJO|nr:threonylcarbamoyladenosine tRNA methylthiotransferase isoform X1 [Lates japonicus]